MRSVSCSNHEPTLLLLLPPYLVLYCYSKCLMMACNGMTPSSFPSSNFIFQIQAPFQQQQQQQQEATQEPIPSPITSLLHLNPTRSRSMSLSGLGTTGEAGAAAADEDLSDEDGGSPAGGEKKRRLNTEQVRALEKSFELGNKLEPERKMQLARAVGLRPRQVAIWFQNRRARWKTKQLEKDFDVLKKEFEAIKAENKALHEQNKKLQAEITSLKGKETSDLINLNKETEVSCSNRSENSSEEVNLDDISRNTSVIDISSCPGPLQTFPYLQSIRPDLQSANNRDELDKDSSTPDLGSFNNLLLCSLGDQSSFWPWTDNHNFR